MYNHRTPQKQVDVVDLDPYGTAAPFIDAAVQCVHDGGERRVQLVVNSSSCLSFVRPVVCYMHRPGCPCIHELLGEVVSHSSLCFMTC